MRTRILLTSALTLVACGDRDFNKPARLDKPRVLAIRAEPPQPGFGVTTTLSTLLYQPPIERVASACPDPGQATYEWSWCPWPVSSNDNYACPLPEASFQALFASLGLGVAPSYALGTGATVPFTNPFPASVLYALCRGDIGSTLDGLASVGGVDGGAGRSVFSCDLPATDYNVADPAKTDPIGFKVNIMVKVTPDCPLLLPNGFSPLTAVYSLHLPTNDEIPGNRNPDFQGITAPLLAEGQPATRDKHIDLQLAIDIGQSEHLTVPSTVDYDSSNGRTRHYEHLDFAWYAEGGDFSGRGKGETTGYVPTAQPQGEDAEPSPDDVANFAFNTSNQWDSPKIEDYPYGTAAIVVVVRDGRGGVGWSSMSLPLEAKP
jgi:hypothetical protein